MRDLRITGLLCSALFAFGCSDAALTQSSGAPSVALAPTAGASAQAPGSTPVGTNAPQVPAKAPAMPSPAVSPISPASGAPAAAAGAGATTPAMPPGSNAGDRFDDVGTNPFVRVDHDPFSTFAADVDTASYDILRRDIQLNMLPQPASVRLEEYVNYFAYDYKTPGDRESPPFAISLAAAPNILDTPTTLLRVGIATQENPEFVKRPANVVFLVDVSGSMDSPDKLPVVQVMLDHTLDTLQQGDTVSIVTYASGTGVRLGPTPAEQVDTIRPVIANLRAGGATAGAAGLDLAYQQARAAFKPDGINHIILCTDGDFNVGPSSTEALLEQIKQQRTTGVTLTAVGFGIGNLNDEMMEKVSNAGNGIHALISDADYARRYAEERMLSTMVHVAKDMKIQLEFNPEHVTAYRLLGYENRAIADSDFRDDSVDAGGVGSGHRVTALYELVMKGDEIPSPTGAKAIASGDPVDGEREIDASDLVLVKVRYKAIDAGDEDEALEVQQSLTPDQVAKSYREADPDLRWATAVAAFAEILKQSPYANRDFMQSIQGVVAEQAARDKDRTEFQTLFIRATQFMR